MTGEELARLMENEYMQGALAKHARRYSKSIEDQEEYIQDAWLRISQKPGDKTFEYYEEQGRKAIHAANMRKWRVHAKKKRNVNGISVTGKDTKPPPKRAWYLGFYRWFDPEKETIDWEYYDGQEKEMEEAAGLSLHWYNWYPDFEQLDSHEQRKVIGRFMNSGYSVNGTKGRPIGATPGTKAKYHKIYFGYTVDRSGVVEPFRNKRIHESKLGDGYRKVSSDADTDVDFGLTEWYHLRELGGSEEWLAWLDATIAWLEKKNPESQA
jgi:hypothetical protein